MSDKSYLIKDTTKEEREQFIRDKHRCISDCDNCGMCMVFHGKTPEIAYADYIDGIREYLDVSKDFQR